MNREVGGRSASVSRSAARGFAESQDQRDQQKAGKARDQERHLPAAQTKGLLAGRVRGAPGVDDRAAQIRTEADPDIDAQ
jgi:hypothetical protein